jgi:acyl-CoA synthetase (NDP forming)
VIVAVPRAVAPRILENCIQKDVGAAHFFTSGFAETDTEEGIKLEKSLSDKARQANFHLIGPNCMGIYIPSSGIRQTMWQKTGFKGNIGFISQSGTHAGTFSQEAYLQGLEINKSVSFGNGLVLDSTDYLEYFGHDPEIKAVGMYLEGVKDGNQFLKVLREVASRKPVVIWKGGRTEEGGRAIASHTGSLSVPRVIWDAAVRQGGGLKVNGMEELTDTLKAILSLSRVFGNRVGIAGGSGGQSVAIADVFAEAGLKVPTLTQASYDRLSSFFLLVGSAYKNPIDPGVNRKEMKRILEILEQDANIDNLVLLETILPIRRSSKHREIYIKALIDIRQRSPKPVAVILGPVSPEMMGEAGALMHKLREGNIPTFLNLERGARALKNTLDYYRLKEKRIE